MLFSSELLFIQSSRKPNMIEHTFLVNAGLLPPQNIWAINQIGSLFKRLWAYEAMSEY